MTKSERWILSEWQVCCHLEDRGETLLEHRFKTPYAEVDLILGSSCAKIVSLVEVKSAGFWEGPMISVTQRQRLFRARGFVESASGFETRLRIALVSYGRRGWLEPEIEVLDLGTSVY